MWETSDSVSVPALPTSKSIVAAPWWGDRLLFEYSRGTPLKRAAATTVSGDVPCHSRAAHNFTLDAPSEPPADKALRLTNVDLDAILAMSSEELQFPVEQPQLICGKEDELAKREEAVHLLEIQMKERCEQLDLSHAALQAEIAAKEEKFRLTEVTLDQTRAALFESETELKARFDELFIREERMAEKEEADAACNSLTASDDANQRPTLWGPYFTRIPYDTYSSVDLLRIAHRDHCRSLTLTLEVDIRRGELSAGQPQGSRFYVGPE
jgi:hypothetical protein